MNTNQSIVNRWLQLSNDLDSTWLRLFSHDNDEEQISSNSGRPNEEFYENIFDRFPTRVDHATPGGTISIEDDDDVIIVVHHVTTSSVESGRVSPTENGPVTFLAEKGRATFPAEKGRATFPAENGPMTSRDEDDDFVMRPKNPDYIKMFDSALAEFEVLYNQLQAEPSCSSGPTVVSSEPITDAGHSPVIKPYFPLTFIPLKIKWEPDEEQCNSCTELAAVVAKTCRNSNKTKNRAFENRFPAISSVAREKRKRRICIRPNSAAISDWPYKRFLDSNSKKSKWRIPCAVCKFNVADIGATKRKHALKHVPEKTPVKWLFECLLCETSPCRSLYVDVVVEKHIPRKHNVLQPKFGLDYVNRNEQLKEVVRSVYDMCFPY